MARTCGLRQVELVQLVGGIGGEVAHELSSALDRDLALEDGGWDRQCQLAGQVTEQGPEFLVAQDDAARQLASPSLMAISGV